MNRNRTRFLALLAIPGIAMGVAQGTSQARTIVPSAGRAVSAADYGCFALDASTMTNAYCSTKKELEIPLVVDAAATYNVTVTAIGASPSNTVGCKSVSVSKNGFVYQASARVHLASFGVAGDLVTSVIVPSGGGLFVNCEVFPNGKVTMVNWY